MEIRPDSAILTSEGEIESVRKLAKFASRSFLLRPVSEFLPRMPVGIHNGPVVISDTELGALETVASRASRFSLRYGAYGSILLRNITEAPYIEQPGLMTPGIDNDQPQAEHDAPDYDSLCEFGIAAAADCRSSKISSTRQVPVY